VGVSRSEAGQASVVAAPAALDRSEDPGSRLLLRVGLDALWAVASGVGSPGAPAFAAGVVGGVGPDPRSVRRLPGRRTWRRADDLAHSDRTDRGTTRLVRGSGPGTLPKSVGHTKTAPKLLQRKSF